MLDADGCQIRCERVTEDRIVIGYEIFRGRLFSKSPFCLIDNTRTRGMESDSRMDDLSVFLIDHEEDVESLSEEGEDI